MAVDLKKIPLHFFNTESRKKEAFKPNDNIVTLYTCGPTVYDYAHIGNFRAYMFEDLLRRTLKYFGYNVKQAMNLTDVDDKTIRGAIAKKVGLNEYTKTYKDAFFKDLKILNIEPVEFYPAATDYIPDMIEMISTLQKKGFAYQGKDGSVYYPISKFKRYGCLSHLHLDELQAGASERVNTDEYDKDHVADFVLWKNYDPARDGDIYWESPFGKGRPGWHLECSTMAIRLLGNTVDIHCGGVDNMFPHHENEIAQSEAYSDKQFVRYWMHAEHLLVDNKKMSKSLGNFYKLQDLLDKGFTGPQIRYMLIHTHYKSQLNFTFAGLEGAKVSLQRLNDFIHRLTEINSGEDGGKVAPILQKAEQDFANGLADDLNISVSLAALFDLVREINALADAKQVGTHEAQQLLDLLKRFNTVLGFLDFKQELDIPQDVKEAFENRLKARKEKNYAQADQYRDYILSKGYVIEDTSQGARLKKS
jgi:cysteinyl-tRNA synthetase